MRLGRGLERAAAGLVRLRPAAAGNPPPAAVAPTSLAPAGASRALVGMADAPPTAAWQPVGSLRRPSLRALSFVIVVLIPTALAAAYYFLIAADQYVAEFRFTLDTAEPRPLDPLALLAGGASQSPAALESQILVQYMTSRAIVDQVGQSLDVRGLFMSPMVDWWSRLPRSAPIEELVRYWKGQVDPFYDPADGTVTVRVRAFAPQDALRLAQAIVAAGEALVNDLSLRARRDALRHAEDDVRQTEARLQSVLGGIREFREREGLIDPGKTADATGAIAARLRDQLVRANAELATLKTYMRDDAPTVRVLQARIRSLEAQRRSLAREMTGPGKPGASTISGVLGSYEELQSKRQFAEAAYQHALRRLDQARADADRQRVFVASFIPPSLPEEALYPRRWRALGTVALVAFALWGIGGLALQSIRDHL